MNTPMSGADKYASLNNAQAASLDLLPYFSGVIWARWLLLLAMLAGGCLSWWLASGKLPVYESGAKVSVIDIEDPGGVSPDDRRAPEVLTLVEHGFVMGTTHDNYQEVMLERLRSRNFTVHFLDSENIYRYFYPAKWDEERQQWRDGFQPDRGAVFTQFRDEVRYITVDEETGIVRVGMRWADPELPVLLANRYVASFNQYMRDRTRADVEAKQAFLEEKLRNSDLLDIQQSIYRLMEAQTAIMMLVNAREEYVLEVIDPAARPYRSVSISVKKKSVIGAGVALLLGLFGVLLTVFLRELWRELRAQLNSSEQRGSNLDHEVKSA